MTAHRFEVGQPVRVSVTAALTLTRPGVYTVMAQLPPNGPYGTVNQYRVRSESEPYDRIIAEPQLRSADDADATPRAT